MIEKQIIKSIIETVAKNGFHKKDFLVIIENSETNLTVPNCYDWENYIGKLCKNTFFIN